MNYNWDYIRGGLDAVLILLQHGELRLAHIVFESLPEVPHEILEEAKYERVWQAKLNSWGVTNRSFGKDEVLFKTRYAPMPSSKIVYDEAASMDEPSAKEEEEEERAADPDESRV